MVIIGVRLRLAKHNPAQVQDLLFVDLKNNEKEKYKP